ncbi:MAG: 16S rRNA (cytosine(1402)-N(4))-methyltransferase RsmH [Bacteroidetes bacterium]|nr:16S rRNA (cytosine(1402)-N(4))-methyltransferase RsmH [Bacteroidota bacterium]MBU1718473.1 16S rRNA (cytosine(1402)-N(4))-methyltransferase RsmH [Bacteroidota bacterium]
MAAYHDPVLKHVVVEGLNIHPNGTYVDLTFGGGGHSREILGKLKNGKLIAFDQDQDANRNAINDPRFFLVNANFRFLTNFLRYFDAIPVDGILADLGISSHQIDDADRGFSFRFDAALDLRMNRNASSNAADIINQADLHELIQLLRKYGELDNAPRIAREIISSRPIASTKQLADAISKLMLRGKENKGLAKVFQAFRIAVNDEIKTLEEMLMQLPAVVKPGGRIAVISYNSLEDRLVKNFIRAGKFDGEVEKDFYGNPLAPFNAVNRKVITPDDQELQTNPRSRSAKLRIAERI